MVRSHVKVILQKKKLRDGFRVSGRGLGFSYWWLVTVSKGWRSPCTVPDNIPGISFLHSLRTTNKFKMRRVTLAVFAFCSVVTGSRDPQCRGHMYKYIYIDTYVRTYLHTEFPNFLCYRLPSNMA